MKRASTAQRTLWHEQKKKNFHPAQVQTWNCSSHQRVCFSMKVFQLPATTSCHKLSLTRVTSAKQSWSVPVSVGLFQLDGGAITSCRAASLLCCRRWGVGVHLRKHKEPWDKLGEHATFAFDQNRDDTGEKEQPQQFCPKRRQELNTVSTSTSYLLLFHQVSWSVMSVLTRGSAKLVTCCPCACNAEVKVTVKTEEDACVSATLVLHCCTFLTGESDPAVQAAAAAVPSVALRPVLTLAGLCAVWPVTIRSAVWHTNRDSWKIRKDDRSTYRHVVSPFPSLC